VDLSLKGSAKLGTTPLLAIQGAVPNSLDLLLISSKGIHLDIPTYNLTLMTGLPFLGAIAFQSSSTGAQSVPIALPSDPKLDKLPIYFQLLSFDLKKSFLASNGLELRLCR